MWRRRRATNEVTAPVAEIAGGCDFAAVEGEDVGSGGVRWRETWQSCYDVGGGWRRRRVMKGVAASVAEIGGVCILQYNLTADWLLRYLLRKGTCCRPSLPSNSKPNKRGCPKAHAESESESLHTEQSSPTMAQARGRTCAQNGI